MNQPVRVALLVPLGSPDPNLQRIGRDLVNAGRLAQADVRNAEIDLQVYETGGTFAGGQAAATRAINEGAKIIVGPLLSTETAGADPVARNAGLKMLTFSNNPVVAAPGVYLLGVTPGASAIGAGRLRPRARAQQLRRALRPGRDRRGDPRFGDRGGQRRRRPRGLDPGLSLFAAGRASTPSR